MSTRATALLGRGIQYSLSPALHQRAAARLGLDVSYILFDAEVEGFEEPDAMTRLGELNLVGANVTQPFKQVAYRNARNVDPVARTVGAVNTIVYGKDGTTGYNTDVDGFGAELDLGIGVIAGSHVVQFGAGGAGAAAAYALLDRDVAELWIIDSQAERARRLADRLSHVFAKDRLRHGALGDVPHAAQHAHGIVNASTAGSAAHPGSPIKANLVREGMWVADVLYAPTETELLRDARLRGAAICNGGLMLVHQAAKSFEIFHGQRPDVDGMWQDFLDLTEGQP